MFIGFKICQSSIALDNLSRKLCHRASACLGQPAQRLGGSEAHSTIFLATNFRAGCASKATGMSLQARSSATSMLAMVRSLNFSESNMSHSTNNHE